MNMVLDKKRSNFGVDGGCDFKFGLLWYFITKCDSYFITISGKSLLQNASAFYYKIRLFYYKMQLLLKNALVKTINAKRDSLLINLPPVVPHLL